MNTGQATQRNRRVNEQRLRAYKHIEHNQGKQQQVSSNQKQTGTNELMRTGRTIYGHKRKGDTRHGDTKLPKALHNNILNSIQIYIIQNIYNHKIQYNHSNNPMFTRTKENSQVSKKIGRHKQVLLRQYY